MKTKITYRITGLLLSVILLLITACSKSPATTVNNKLKIGVILSLSGNGRATGENTLKGIKLAVKEQNEKGGLLNRQIELDVQDSKGDPATGTTIINEMLGKSERPFMVCTNTSGVSLAVKTETEKAKIILVASAATDKLLDNSNYTIRNFIESGQISDEILKYLKNSLDLHSIGIFYANNEFGNSVSSKIAGKAASFNTQLVFNISYDDKTPDYKSLIDGTTITLAPAIYVVGLGPSLGTFIKQLREADYKGIIIADPLFNNADVKAAAGNAANGVKFIDFAFDKNAGTPAVKLFVRDYVSEFHSSPENLSAITYDALKMLFAGIEKVGSLDYEKIPKPSADKKYNGVTGKIWVDDGNIIYPTIFKLH